MFPNFSVLFDAAGVDAHTAKEQACRGSVYDGSRIDEESGLLFIPLIAGSMHSSPKKKIPKQTPFSLWF